MHSISWLQISDLHMRVSEAWSHDVVLKALCEDIERKRREGTASDFILVTGDLAFSGSSKEYKLVKGFFDALIAASGVPSERIFCIPGNHDIQRDRQKMCFRGSRGFIQSQNQIDILLSPGDDLRTLLDRQKNYRRFQGALSIHAHGCSSIDLHGARTAIKMLRVDGQELLVRF